MGHLLNLETIHFGSNLHQNVHILVFELDWAPMTRRDKWLIHKLGLPWTSRGLPPISWVFPNMGRRFGLETNDGPEDLDFSLKLTTLLF